MDISPITDYHHGLVRRIRSELKEGGSVSETFLRATNEVLVTKLVEYHQKERGMPGVIASSEFAITYMERGVVLSLLGDFETAHRCYEMAGLLHPKLKDAVLMEQARSFMMQGDFEEVHATFAHAYHDNTNNKQALYGSLATTNLWLRFN